MTFIQDISEFIFLNDKIEESDIIFIPGGSYPELGEYAARLWNNKIAPYVMPSGGVSIKTGKFNGVKSKKNIYSKDYKTDCEFLTDVLKINGVPEEAIICEDKSSFTKENAILSKRILDLYGMKIKKAIICCKSFHARRALLCYQFAFPKTEFLMHPYPYVENNVEISKLNWHNSEIGIKRVLGELQRCGNQFEEEFIRLLE
ncbi:YdcF family protein [Spirochaeta isovalerica]|uniref:Uncharacterized SAM-binding protein YcdF (DUF218 family) n=1 Tax=Spirochaeta isovalerica TaxID=150 RepID=A0A841RE66_9SPIO|nr:YdcF family protein [Spirochaeta isovalerica]MBB6482283.1 uncharacterized SAM-binding protein YcdF (DUF218 family) [Spirochaeta isovalerica]